MRTSLLYFIGFIQPVSKFDNHNVLSKHGLKTWTRDSKRFQLSQIKLSQGNINETTGINRGRSSESIVYHMGRKASEKEVREE